MIGGNPTEWEALQEDPDQGYQGEEDPMPSDRVDAEMEKRLETWASEMERRLSTSHGSEKRYHEIVGLVNAIRALLDDWKQRGEELEALQQPVLKSEWQELQEENERLRWKVEQQQDPSGPLAREQALRIEAALALHYEVEGWCGRCAHEDWPCPTVKALQGESKLHGGDGDSCPICSTKQARIKAALTIYDRVKTYAQVWWEQIAGDMAKALRGEGGSDAD